MYCETNHSLYRSIKIKSHELLTEGVDLLHVLNARSYMLRITCVKTTKFNWGQLVHPSYSPDMSPCEFYVFGPLKKRLKKQGLNSDNELKDAVKD